MPPPRALWLAFAWPFSLSNSSTTSRPLIPLLACAISSVRLRPLRLHASSPSSTVTLPASFVALLALSAVSPPCASVPPTPFWPPVLHSSSLPALHAVFSAVMSTSSGDVAAAAEIPAPAALYSDSKSAVDLAFDPVAFKKTKHILRAAEYLRDLVSRDVIVVYHTPGRTMIADILTKAVAHAIFVALLALVRGLADGDVPVVGPA